MVIRVNKNKDFDDFAAFNKFMGSGFGSNNNILYLSGGFSKTINYMFLYKNKYNDHIKIYKVLVKFIMNEATLDYIHKIDDKNQKVQWALLGLTNLADNHYRTETGNPQWLKCINDKSFPNKNVELINLNMAKQAISNNGWKATNHSSSGAYFKWLNTYLKTSPTNTPLNLLVSELSLHNDYYDKNGTYKMVKTNNLNNAYNSLVLYLTNIFKVLKAIKNNETNVFDNSMIIIYGDYVNHRHMKYDDKKSIK